MLRHKIPLFIVTSLLSLAAFTGIALLLQATGLFDQAQLNAQISTEERTWQAQGVGDYRIEVRVISSIWHAQTYSITVQDNQVVAHESSCIPAPFEGRECETRDYDPADFTVEGLFAIAGVMAQRYSNHTTIRYDERYHFPLTIGYNDPQILDEDAHWEVLSFEVLP